MSSSTATSLLTRVHSNSFLKLFQHLGQGHQVTKPILSAPMAFWSSAHLVATVSNHHGLGVFPIGYFKDADSVVQELSGMENLLQKRSTIDNNNNNSNNQATKDELLPYAVGFITFWLDRQGGTKVLQRVFGKQEQQPSGSLLPPAAVWFSFGDYRPYLSWIRQNAHPLTRVIVQVHTVDQILQAEKDGVDVIVVQGNEAGGHGQEGNPDLKTLLIESVAARQQSNNSTTTSTTPRPPLIAAGGIMSNKDYKRVQGLGASGVVLGTALMPTTDSFGPQKAKELLIKTGSRIDCGPTAPISTSRTKLFDSLRQFDWPFEFDGRAIYNKVSEREQKILKVNGNEKGHELLKENPFAVMREDLQGTKQDWEKAVQDKDYENFLPVFVGVGVDRITRLDQSATEVMDEILSGVDVEQQE